VWVEVFTIVLSSLPMVEVFTMVLPSLPIGVLLLVQCGVCRALILKFNLCMILREIYRVIFHNTVSFVKTTIP